MNKFSNSPYKDIPEELKSAYTMNGKIPIFDGFCDNSKENGVKWDNELITTYINRFTPNNIRNNCEGSSSYGHEPCVQLLNAFEKYNIINKNVAVVGSETPWIEAILINLHNMVTTIEYNVPESNYSNLVCQDYFEFFEKSSKIFDAVVTFSSIEHSGLGRYGDPLDPNGDIKTMETIHNNLVDNGLVIWGAPVGADALTWNAHRIYGKIRLPLIFNKFKELEWFEEGISTKKNLLNLPHLGNGDHGYQPVVVLKKVF